MRLSDNELVALANLYLDTDPNLSSTILALVNCRMADKILGSSTHSLEEWMMNLLVAITNQALYAVQYGKWLVTGGTDDEKSTKP